MAWYCSECGEPIRSKIQSCWETGGNCIPEYEGPARRSGYSTQARPASSSERLATYKGHQYKVLYHGPTKYGERVHLQFRDGSKDFWVAANLVQE